MKPIKNDFNTYDFTDEELVEACKLTDLQKAFLQHQVGLLSIEKIRMKFDPKDAMDFMQNEAHLTGQLNAYEFLLTSHEQSAEVVKEMLVQLQQDASKRAGGITSESSYKTFQKPPQPLN